MGYLNDLLQEVLIYGKEEAALVKKTAQLAGVAYKTVWDQCHGIINPSVRVLRGAFLATGDPRLKAELEPAGWKLVPTKAVQPDWPDLTDEIADINIAVAELLREARKVTAPDSDGGVDVTARELVGLDRKFSALLVEVAQVEERIARIKRRAEGGDR